jgi:hypothetical protein
MSNTDSTIPDQAHPDQLDDSLSAATEALQLDVVPAENEFVGRRARRVATDEEIQAAMVRPFLSLLLPKVISRRVRSCIGQIGREVRRPDRVTHFDFFGQDSGPSIRYALSLSLSLSLCLVQ